MTTTPRPRERKTRSKTRPSKPVKFQIADRTIDADEIARMFYAWGELVDACRRVRNAADDLQRRLATVYGPNVEHAIARGCRLTAGRLKRAARKAGEDAAAAMTVLAGDDAPAIARNFATYWSDDQ